MSFFLLSSLLAFNPTATLDELAGKIGLSTEGDLIASIFSILRLVLGLVGLITLIFIIAAGFLWMTAAGNEERIKKAKDVLKNSVLGLAIVILSYSLLVFIGTLF